MSKKKAAAKKADKSIYKITERRDGRFLVKKRDKYIHGTAKVEVLVAAGKIKLPISKPKPQAEATEAVDTASSNESPAES